MSLDSLERHQARMFLLELEALPVQDAADAIRRHLQISDPGLAYAMADMRKRPDWTKPAWLKGHVRTREGFGGEATADGVRRQLLTECAGEFEAR